MMTPRPTPPIAILTEEDLRAHVYLDADSVACIEDAFAALATRRVAMPPVLRLDIPEHNGEVDVKTAYVPGVDSFAIKVSPGFFDNPKRGLPSLNGLMLLFSAHTGLAEAVLLDNGYLTDLRTAAAGAVAARHLARPDARRAAVLGAGAQARLQVKALTLVRPIEEAVIWARRPEAARQAADDLADELGIKVGVAASPREAVEAGDIVVTATPSREPLVKAEWLRPGQHVTAMGSDSEHKNELDPAVVARADVYVCDRRSQCAALGELHHAITRGVVPDASAFPELGEVIAGRAQGRSGADQVTVCDLTGTGVQDTAIATFARERCRSAAGASPSVS